MSKFENGTRVAVSFMDLVNEVGTVVETRNDIIGRYYAINFDKEVSRGHTCLGTTPNKHGMFIPESKIILAESLVN